MLSLITLTGILSSPVALLTGILATTDLISSVVTAARLQSLSIDLGREGADIDEQNCEARLAPILVKYALKSSATFEEMLSGRMRFVWPMPVTSLTTCYTFFALLPFRVILFV